MMARLSTVFIAFLVAFALVGFAQVPTAPAAIFHHSYKGKATSYDESGKSLVVSGKEGEKTFDLSRAKMDGAIRPNEDVVVKYDNEDGRLVASSVKVEHKAYGSQMDGSYNMPGSYR